AVVEDYVDTHDRTPLPGDFDPADAGRYLAAAEGFRARRPDGSTFCVEATIGRIHASDDRRYLLILRDVEEMKQAEEQLTQLQSEKVYLREEIESEYNFEEIVGQSDAVQSVFDAIDQVAETDATVLVRGETGTGKELVARAVHRRSHRGDAMLVKVNCAALPSNLIESELFGHEKGAFTGATEQRVGRFELADGGTVFLDEIGELPLETQVKLLRVLQEQEFERVGGSETIEVDTRILAATNRDLETDVEAGRFRADVYYRLNIFPIEVPPLRDRDGDVPLLANHFVEKFAGQTGKDVNGLSAGAMTVLQRYDWPGNVRELANIIERAVILTREDIVRAEHLSIRSDEASGSDGFRSLEEVQRQHIIEALVQTGGVVGGGEGAARLLDMNRTTLLSRMDRLGVDPADYR
ncbi:MAG: PAS domain S-box protein, partial [Bacteroidetes bacterium]|nr:PAS domain S-box protein [Bacteroidota bacterium]